MDYLSIFFVSFTIALSGALAPGPLLSTVIAKSIHYGSKTGPALILGHAILEILMVIIIIFGLSNFINTPAVVKSISIAGIIILVLFGIKMLLSAKNISLNPEKTDIKKKNLPLLGITMSIANPYWSIWWLTIGLGLVLGANRLGLLGIGIFFIGHILADLIWYSTVSLAVSRGKRFITEKLYRAIISGCGITLIGFGIYFSITLL